MKEREGSDSSNFPKPQSNPALDTQSISRTKLQMLIMNHVVFWLTIDAWKEEGIQDVARRNPRRCKKESKALQEGAMGRRRRSLEQAAALGDWSH
ncbi:hypothetical protein Pyn_04588 [Prunus yedoensis var. nudiflora]|uniref:Uncharacterized protein n=1 Tax=Prunus yedoensis var. nudiflora TaxID=2094558 RepID=A0A314ZWU3_PRUYE|nr:hypothetical protein Pyn_04588 [Prunus yedoensis var. nudiflora]